MEYLITPQSAVLLLTLLSSAILIMVLVIDIFRRARGGERVGFEVDSASDGFDAGGHGGDGGGGDGSGGDGGGGGD
jgi:hypothetical protein